MKKAKISFLSAIVFCAAMFASCSFDAKVDTPSPVPFSPPTPLERREALALLHLETSHEVTPEVLQGQVNSFLAGNATARGADSPASVVTGIRKFTTVLDDGFATTTSNSRSASIEQEASEIPFYLFDIENPVEQTSGYALTCGDTRLPNIIAVVEDGEFAEGDHPFNDVFYSNLAAYIMETVEIYNSVTDEDITTVVEKAGNTRSEQRATTVVKRHFIDLTAKTTWGQANPYYDVVNAFKGIPLTSFAARYPTGCVATAVAQIMAYHKYPSWPATTMSGKTTFTDPYTNTDKTFSSVTYEWDNMTKYPDAKSFGSMDTDKRYKMEIGVLMLEIGLNVKMDYQTGGSGAYDSDVVTGITKMGYLKPSLVDYNWAKIQASIDASKPVYVSAYAAKTTSTYYEKADIFKWFPKTRTTYSEGHAWVIDNYQIHTDGSLRRDYVHCNLGWGDTASNKLKSGWYYSGIFHTEIGPDFRGTAGTPGYYQYVQRIIPDITPNHGNQF